MGSLLKHAGSRLTKDTGLSEDQEATRLEPIKRKSAALLALPPCGESSVWPGPEVTLITEGPLWRSAAPSPAPNGSLSLLPYTLRASVYIQNLS